MHKLTDIEKNSKEKFVFFKQRATDVAVETKGEVIVDVLNTLLDIV